MVAVMRRGGMEGCGCFSCVDLWDGFSFLVQTGDGTSGRQGTAPQEDGTEGTAAQNTVVGL